MFAAMGNWKNDIGVVAVHADAEYGPRVVPPRRAVIVEESRQHRVRIRRQPLRQDPVALDDLPARVERDFVVPQRVRSVLGVRPALLTQVVDHLVALLQRVAVLVAVCGLARVTALAAENKLRDL
jgi:hypothetical protein